MVTQSADGTLTFQFFRADAHHVCLAGDFNGWQPHTLHMNKSSDGWFQCRLSLAPGTYRFRYCADGCWFTDYAAFGVEPSPLGLNSVLVVEPVRVKARPVRAAKRRSRRAA